MFCLIPSVWGLWATPMWFMVRPLGHMVSAQFLEVLETKVGHAGDLPCLCKGTPGLGWAFPVGSIPCVLSLYLRCKNRFGYWLISPSRWHIYHQAANRVSATQATSKDLYISLPNKTPDEKLLLSYIFIFLSSGKHIPDSKVINMNKESHFKGTFNLQNWGLHQSLLDLHTLPKHFFPIIFCVLSGHCWWVILQHECY